MRVFEGQVNHAESDGLRYHFPVINHFINDLFDLEYPDVIPMLPGYHYVFAIVARLFTIDPLVPDDVLSFFVQSFWAAGLFFILYKISQCFISKHYIFSWLVISFGSSYILMSWAWPTTDLAGMTFYALSAYCLLYWRDNFKSALFFSITVVSLAFIRQNYILICSVPFLLWLGRVAKVDFSLNKLFYVIVPILVGLIFLTLLLWGWGGLVPYSFRQHGGTQIHLFQLGHMLSLTGILILPFFVVRARCIFHEISLRNNILFLFLSVAITVLTLMSLRGGEIGSIIWSFKNVLELITDQSYFIFAGFLILTIYIGLICFFDVVSFSSRSCFIILLLFLVFF